MPGRPGTPRTPAATTLSRPNTGSSKCATTQQKMMYFDGQPVHADLVHEVARVVPKIVVHAYVLVDASGSMQSKVNGDTTKMDAVASALTEQFIQGEIGRAHV